MIRIGFTGGGTGGHFYPLIAVAEEIRHKYAGQDISLFNFGDSPYSAEDLKNNNIQFVKISSGKSRLYSSFSNFLDYFKVSWGVVQAMGKLAVVYPDVIFSKGGYVSFPVLVAARLLRIPVVAHDSDTICGRATIYAAKFAKIVCVAWPEGGEYLQKYTRIDPSRIVYTGLPIRFGLNPNHPRESYAFSEFNRFDPRIPTILIIGGSQGAENINNVVIKSLGQLLPNVQVIHQTGQANFERVKKLTDELLRDMPEKKSYIPVGTLSSDEIRNAYSMVSLVVSRGGSQMLEFFAYGLPSIVIPIPQDISRDQRSNSFAAMRRGASVVIEEKNLTSTILLSEIRRLVANPDLLTEMKEAAKKSARLDAAEQIADILLHIATDK
jgi:UDP-N-acetylglucosamine--N-acetylmuramyl-(pentapeptide) pyrophosphoryl-undecaprenol N-acetylglucosamine transferase